MKNSEYSQDFLTWLSELKHTLPSQNWQPLVKWDSRFVDFPVRNVIETEEVLLQRVREAHVMPTDANNHYLLEAEMEGFYFFQLTFSLWVGVCVYVCL
jgi:hypothetical protein